MATAVLVIDMVRGFFEEGYNLYLGSQARHIIPNVRKLLDTELSKGSKILFLCDHHDPDDLEFKVFPPHCVAGTIETEVIPELRDIPGEIVPKKRFSAFFGSTLGDRLKALNPDKLLVCGVCTDICVMHTVEDARNMDYQVEVPIDCVTTFDQKAHYFALEHMEKVLGAKLVYPGKGKLPQTKFETDSSIISGDTADIYFVRTLEILRAEAINPVVTMEVFPSHDGVFCGIEEVLALLQKVLPEGQREVWALAEGEPMKRKEVVLRITAPYQSFCIYETAYLGILSHCSGWATAARECATAAASIPVISFGVRHVHPLIGGIMDYAAIVGGCVGCSSIDGARLAGTKAAGTMPHALILTMGDTAKATLAFDRHMPPEVPRISLVDTLKDEVEESVLVAKALKGKLQGVRLDTPTERGRVTADLVKEVRAHLDLAGYKEVKITVSGGLDPERIRYFAEQGAPVDMYGVGSYISGAKPIDFTADLHEVSGRAVAKRGRLPGITPNPRLKRVL